MCSPHKPCVIQPHWPITIHLKCFVDHILLMVLKAKRNVTVMGLHPSQVYSHIMQCDLIAKFGHIVFFSLLRAKSVQSWFSQSSPFVMLLHSMPYKQRALQWCLYRKKTLAFFKTQKQVLPFCFQHTRLYMLSALFGISVAQAACTPRAVNSTFGPGAVAILAPPLLLSTQGHE